MEESWGAPLRLSPQPRRQGCVLFSASSSVRICCIHLDASRVTLWGFPDGSLVKNLPAIWETWVQSLGWEDPLEKGNGNPFKYSCLEHFMDRAAWQATVHKRVGHDRRTDTFRVTL